MKICIVSNLFPPFTLGGAEIYAERTARLLSQDHDVFVISTRAFEGLGSLKPELAVENGLKVYRFYPLNLYWNYDSPKKSLWLKPFWHLIDLWNLHTYITIKKILEREKPDIVHSHNLNGFSWATFQAVKSLDLPLVHTIHDLSLLCPNAVLFRNNGNCLQPRLACRLLKAAKRWVVGSKPDLVLSPSEFTLNLHALNGFFQESGKEKMPLFAESRQPGKRSGERFNILFVGRLNEMKGVETLIDSFNGLKDKTLELHLVGYGQLEDSLKDKAGQNPNIKFWGWLDAAQLAKRYEKANVCVVPSISFENSPTVIYESFSFGVPVVASQTGGIPELVEEGVTGFLFPPGDVEGLKTALTKLVEEPERARKMGLNALKKISGFSDQALGKKLLECYDQARRCGHD